MSVLGVATSLVLSMLVLTILLAFGRLVRGPSLPDRVVALDLVGVTSVGLVAVVAVATDEPTLLRAATVQALVAFLGTVAFAYYVERKK
jgi:multicomponent Na+:H+ antiporter subunit F